MPDRLEAFAAHRPVTVVVDARRGLMLGPGAIPAGRTVAGGLRTLWSVALLALFAPLAVRAYRRT